MNEKILHTEVQQWLIDNLNTELTKLILKGSPFKDITTKELVEQLESRRKTEKKLPTWFNTGNIYYPKKLSIEQTSSEKTAEYKANLISGDTLIDVTAGYGVDNFYFAKQFKQVIGCETNEELAQIATHNFKELNLSNIKYKTTDGVNLLKKENTKYDWIYIDPARRNDSKGKVFLLEDCLPNVPAILDLLFNRSKNILIKTSPMLDIKQGISELKHVKEIHIVAVKNEVKELLWVLNKDFNKEPLINTSNIGNDEFFSFIDSDEKNTESNFSEPQEFLYDPNNCIRKAGAFKIIGEKFNLKKISVNAHLYTNSKLINFPGRKFKIKETIPYNTKKIKQLFKNQKVNIITRNFSLSVEKLKKQLKIKDGGNTYLFFTTDLNNKKIVLICKRISTDKQNINN